MFESTIVEKFGSNSLPSSPPRHHPVILERDETDAVFTAERATSTGDQDVLGTGQEFSSLEPILPTTEHDIPITELDVPTTQLDVSTMEQPEVHKPESVEHHFAEDSGIVENIEQARAALDDFQNEYDSSAR